MTTIHYYVHDFEVGEYIYRYDHQEGVAYHFDLILRKRIGEATWAHINPRRTSIFAQPGDPHPTALFYLKEFVLSGNDKTHSDLNRINIVEINQEHIQQFMEEHFVDFL